VPHNQRVPPDAVYRRQRGESVACSAPSIAASGRGASTAPVNFNSFGAPESMMSAQPSLRGPFESKGYVVLRDVMPASELPALRTEADQLLVGSSERGGVRNVLAKSALFGDLAASAALTSIAEEVLGPEARPTKLTIFDKTPRANWNVPWHQDLTITVNARVDAPGYGPWSVKDGFPHVQPPVDVLENTLAIRLHLDDTPRFNGALRVLAGTHTLGRLSRSAVAELCDRLEATACSVPAGGAMLMSPLLLHASSRASSPCRRRVLHFEYSAASLPEGLAWSCS